MKLKYLLSLLFILGPIFASATNDSLVLERGDSMIICEQNSTLSSAIGKLNARMRHSSIVQFSEDRFFTASKPFSVSAPTIAHKGMFYSVCVTVTQK